MILFIASAVIFIYLAVRLIWPMKANRLAKLLAFLVLLLVASKHILIEYLFGGLAAPELPRLIQLVWGWLFGALALLFVLMIFRDILLLLATILGRIMGRRFRCLFVRHKLPGLLVLVCLIIGAYGTWQAVKVPEVKTAEAVLPALPPELDGLKVVQLTDIHASELLPRPWVSAVVDKVNALHPDIIVITGDVIDGPVARRFNDVIPLSGLEAEYGVIACVGNHEYYSGLDEWIIALRELGLNLLVNDNTVLNINGVPLVIAGVTDPAAEGPCFNLQGPDISAALNGAPDGAFTILLAHQPRRAETNASAGIDLQLSGHTHGAQIKGLGYIGARMNNGFLRGWYQVGDMKLYISNGTGLWNGFPIRLAVPSEITEIILRSPAVN